jgi:hypothetical protein
MELRAPSQSIRLPTPSTILGSKGVEGCSRVDAGSKGGRTLKTLPKEPLVTVLDLLRSGVDMKANVANN